MVKTIEAALDLDVGGTTGRVHDLAYVSKDSQTGRSPDLGRYSDEFIDDALNVVFDDSILRDGIGDCGADGISKSCPHRAIVQRDGGVLSVELVRQEGGGLKSFFAFLFHLLWLFIVLIPEGLDSGSLRHPRLLDVLHLGLQLVLGLLLVRLFLAPLPIPRLPLSFPFGEERRRGSASTSTSIRGEGVDSNGILVGGH